MISPALESWLLAVPYVLGGLCVLLFAWAAGGPAYCLLAGNRSAGALIPRWLCRPGAGFFLLFTRITAGFTIISWIAAVLGISGLYEKSLVLTVLAAASIAGAAIAGRYGAPVGPLLRHDLHAIRRAWRSSSTVGRALCVIIVTWIAALALNALIGAMVPEFTIDPLWYHLSVPQQWIFDKGFAVYPNVMPSAYPLAVDTIFSVLLLVTPGNSVLSTTFTVMAGYTWLGVTLGAVLLIANRPGMARGAAALGVLGVWCPLIMLYGMTAPVWLKNDIIIVLFSFAGACLLWLPLLAARAIPTGRWWLCAGFLLGTACSSKSTVLGFTASNLLFASITCAVIESTANGAAKVPRKTLTGLSLCLGTMSLAMLPWLIRGITTVGVPLFPIGLSQFSIAPEFKALVTTFHSMHRYEAPGLDNLWQKLSEFGNAIIITSNNRDKCVALYIVVGVIGLVFERWPWRLFSTNLALMLLIFVGMKSQEDIFRFFTPAYGLASLLIGWFIASYARRLSPPMFYIAACVALAVSMFSFARYQYRIASAHYFHWDFKPVLAQEEVLEYAAQSEHGDTYLDFRQISPHILPDERVLLIGSPYPFYLHRSTIWNDPAIAAGGLDDRWRKMTAVEAMEFLRAEQVDVLVLRRNKDESVPGPLHDLVNQGLLETVPLSSPSVSHWTLWRVKKDQ